MDSNAKAYSALNKPQYDIGCEFVRTLNISQGDKVLDMGCGTGELTNFIASVVGQNGEVVGIDPDGARIKIAQEKFKDVHNVKFVVGDSSSGFPHGSEEYYDLHFSNAVFHWLIGDDKQVYLKKAYQCLKPGGRLAIRTVVRTQLTGLVPDGIPIEWPTEEEVNKLFNDVGLFTNVAAEVVNRVVRFASFSEFVAWIKASLYLDSKQLEGEWLKNVKENFSKTEADGTFSFYNQGMFRITAEKKG